VRTRRGYPRALRRRWLWLSTLTSTLCATWSAHADSSFWDEVRDERTLVRAAARRLVVGYAAEPELREVMAACLTALPFATAELKYLCGVRMGRGPSEQKRRAFELLRQALEAEPESSWAGKAWYELGVVGAELGKREMVAEAFSQALTQLWQPAFRARAYYNRGLAYLAQPELTDAASDFRRAILITNSGDVRRLAQFALGVALERQGDLASALSSFQDGLQSPAGTPLVARQESLRLATFSLIPRYEQHYYAALAAMAAADQLPRVEEKLRAYEQAIQEWNGYLDHGRTFTAAWLEHAEANRARCIAKRSELSRGKLKPSLRGAF